MVDLRHRPQTHDVYVSTEGNPALRELTDKQRGVARRDQLITLGCSPGWVAAQLNANRWIAMGTKVVLLQNAAPTRQQLMWIAVLDSETPAALGSHTALELHGFRSMARRRGTSTCSWPAGPR